MSGLVEVRGLVKRFDATDDSGTGAEVLSGVDLDIAPGESVAVVGPSGSGKSTLLNIIGALLPATSGDVLLDGDNLTLLDADALATLRNEKIGFVFQSHHLLPQCTALENVLVPTLVHRDAATRSAAEDRARALLDDVGLGNRLDHRPAQLSGGECQRVAVVRSLINRPRLLLADEPTGSLDAKAADHLGEWLRELEEKEGVALLVVTHSERLAARMQRVVEIRDGRLVSAASDP
ncbi:MAG: ABC transporter [Planctomycetes bacterium]|nr:ABC transporter [Planctomycetota bacterium]